VNLFSFGSEICSRAAILAGGKRASQHSCKSSSSAAEGVHCLKVRIAFDPDLEARRQPCAGGCRRAALLDAFLRAVAVEARALAAQALTIETPASHAAYIAACSKRTRSDSHCIRGDFVRPSIIITAPSTMIETPTAPLELMTSRMSAFSRIFVLCDGSGVR
jgi:hypothetical protein